jgi:hypothetical protein
MEEQPPAPKAEAPSKEAKHEQELKEASWVTAKEWPVLFFYKLRNRIVKEIPNATVASMNEDEGYREAQFDVEGVNVLVVENSDWPFAYKVFVGDGGEKHKELEQRVNEIAEAVDGELPTEPER